MSGILSRREFTQQAIVSSWLSAILLVFIGGSSCSHTPRANNDVNEPASDPSSLRKEAVLVPSGNEVDVVADVVKSDGIVVTVTNRSSRDVFLPYLPGVNSENAFYAYVGLEKRNSTSGKFERFEEGDFGTGSNPLQPGTSFKWSMKLPLKNTYRLNVRYFIDPSLYERKKLFESLTPDDESWRKELEELEKLNRTAIKTITVGPFVL